MPIKFSHCALFSLAINWPHFLINGMLQYSANTAKFQVLYKFSSCIPFAAPLGKGITLFCLLPRLMSIASFNHLWDQYFCSIVLGTPNNYYSQMNNCSHLVHKASIKSPEGGHWKRYFILKAFKYCITAAFWRTPCHSLCILFLSFTLSH